MIAGLLLVSTVAAAVTTALPPRPTAPATATGECQQSVPLRVGSPVPVPLLDGAGLVGCSAVCEPLSSYAHLLHLEKHADAVRELYEIDVARLQADRDYWREKAQTATAGSWYRSPWFAIVTSATLVAASVVTYDQLYGDR